MASATFCVKFTRRASSAADDVTTLRDRVIRGMLRAGWQVASLLLASPTLMRLVRAVVPQSGSERTYQVVVDGRAMYAASLDRLLALYFWKYGVLEAYELEVIRSLIRPGMTVVDVGANIGFHTLQFASWVGPAGHVHAFEPEPANFAVLQRNIAASGFSHVTARQLAIAASSGSAAMYVSHVHRGDHSLLPIERARDAIAVETRSLDALFADPASTVDLIKVDVQGAEVMVLDGMRALIERCPDAIVVIEFSPDLMARSGQEPSAFVDRVAALRRRVRVIDEGRRSAEDCDLVRLRALAATARHLNLILSRA